MVIWKILGITTLKVGTYDVVISLNIGVVGKLNVLSVLGFKYIVKIVNVKFDYCKPTELLVRKLKKIQCR